MPIQQAYQGAAKRPSLCEVDSDQDYGCLPTVLLPGDPPLSSKGGLCVKFGLVVAAHMGVVPLYATRLWPVVFVFLPMMIGVYMFSYSCIFGSFFEDLPLHTELAMAPPMMSLDGVSAAMRFLLGGGNEYLHSRLGMITLCITANLCYWPYLMLCNFDCRRPTRVGWFTRWWLKYGFFGKTPVELEMGAIGIYQTSYMALQHMNVAAMCAASRIPGCMFHIEESGWFHALRVGAFITQCVMLFVNKWAFCLVGLNTVCWVDMFARRKLCPYVQQFPFNVCDHPMFWTGALCYYLMQITPQGVSLYGIFHVTINSIGNYLYLIYFEQPFVNWFFIEEVPVDGLKA